MPLDGRIQDFVPAEVELDIFSLDGLIAWLEKQPADKTYVYHCNGGCLLYQYLTDQGVDVESVYGHGWSNSNGEFQIFPGHVRGIGWDDMPEGYGSPFNIVAVGAIGIGASHEKTYGAALDRAIALRARRKD